MKTAKPPRLSLQGLKVLKAFWEFGRPLTGPDLAAVTQLSTGTLYPLLHRFVRAGILERAKPRGQAARVYRLTERGTEFASKALQEVAL